LTDILPKLLPLAVLDVSVNPTDVQKQQVKEFLTKLKGEEPEDKEIMECCLSLYYTAKATVRFYLLKHGLEKPIYKT
jgi:hypothetical protein